MPGLLGIPEPSQVLLNNEVVNDKMHLPSHGSRPARGAGRK
jgi:hypothetical protein